MTLAPLAPIAILTVGLWVIATVLAIVLIMDKLGAILSAVPVVGNWLGSHVRSMAQAITNACGHMLSGIDHFLGSSFSQLSHFINSLFSQFVAHSAVIAQLAKIVADGLYRVTGLRAIVHRLEKAFHGIEHGIRTLTREWHGIEHRVKRLERDITQGIGHDLRLQIRALKRTLHHVTHDVLPGIRTDVDTAGSAIDHLYEWAKGKAQLVGVGTFAMAVATALGALGLDWIKCKEGKNLYNQRGCAMWSDLGQLLGIAFIAAEVANLDELIHVAQTVTEDVVKGVETLLDV